MRKREGTRPILPMLTTYTDIKNLDAAAFLPGYQNPNEHNPRGDEEYDSDGSPLSRDPVPLTRLEQ